MGTEKLKKWVGREVRLLEKAIGIAKWGNADGGNGERVVRVRRMGNQAAWRRVMLQSDRPMFCLASAQVHSSSRRKILLCRFRIKYKLKCDAARYQGN